MDNMIRVTEVHSSLKIQKEAFSIGVNLLNGNILLALTPIADRVSKSFLFSKGERYYYKPYGLKLISSFHKVEVFVSRRTGCLYIDFDIYQHIESWAQTMEVKNNDKRLTHIWNR